MTTAQEYLYNEIVKLPPEKVNTALSFVRFLSYEQDTLDLLTHEEEAELQELYSSGNFVPASDVFAKIMELPND